MGCGLEASPHFRGDPSHPVNEGTLCARGVAATCEASSRERVLRPLRRAPGGRAWEPVPWDEAMERAARGLLSARAAAWDESCSAARRIAFLGGATAMNEEAYLFARLARHLGVLDLDHQGRLCHAATTTALAATMGLPAATHSWEDLADASWILIQGSNLAEAHPIASRWVHRARRRGARIVTVDPRPSRTALQSDRHLVLRPGTDVALLCGWIAQVLASGALDREWLSRCTDAGLRVPPEAELRGGRFGGYADGRYETRAWDYADHGVTVLSAMERHFARYTPAVVEAITGVPSAAFAEVGRWMSQGRPGAVLYSMGVTQQSSGVQAVRAAAILQALLGNLHRAGGGLYPMKGHANIQGATDLGGQFHLLPGYLPSPTTDDVDLDAYARRHGAAATQHVRRLLATWYGDDGAYRLLPRRRPSDGHSMLAALDRARHGGLDAMVLLGQNPVRGSANPRAVSGALARLAMLVVIDPFPSESARFWEDAPDCGTEVLLLPAASFSEKPGSRTNLCRRVQWQEACEAPRGESLPDAEILERLFHRLRALGPEVEALQRARWPSGYRAALEDLDAACWLYQGASDALRDGGGWHWPKGRTRLIDEEAHVRLWAPLPDGPLPEHYEPMESAYPHPLHPDVPHNPLHPPLPAARTVDEWPLLLSTSIVPSLSTARCQPRGGRRDGPMEAGLAADTGASLGLRDGDPVWIETPRARARAVVRLWPGAAAAPVVWTSSTWADDAETPDLVLPDPADPDSPSLEVRAVPCRLVPR